MSGRRFLDSAERGRARGIYKKKFFSFSGVRGAGWRARGAGARKQRFRTRAGDAGRVGRHPPGERLPWVPGPADMPETIATYRHAIR